MITHLRTLLPRARRARGGARHPLRRAAALIASLIAASPLLTAQEGAGNPTGDPEPGFRFRSGVDLINVSVTVTDSSGRFVPGLRQEDFTVYEDGVPQAITHFSNARVPVSLGLVVDTSGSMAGEKWERAQAALDRFLYDLLGPEDEVFLMQFNNAPLLEQGWTTDRGRIARALRRIVPRGGTAMYDAVAEAIPLADSGRHRKKALVVISDGNDTTSERTISALRDQIRRSELLVYAIGIDGEGSLMPGIIRQPQPRIRRPRPLPFPIPGRRPQWPGTQAPPTPGPGIWTRSDERVNADALRSMTDESGGRTEIIDSARDLDPATAGIADELSRQYFLAYPAAASRDGRWHSIRVEVKDRRYRVRARQGYFAT
ncbi:MAG TPA: VWA domain-containing protein [Vicinamibacterales bacterium]|nr:VWA domain-containing protein [Vicinamibacterales bacterium]